MTDYISDYLDNATDTPKPSRKSRQDLAEHRHSQIEDGFLFPLHATSLGGELEWAQVRRLNVTETAVVEALPAHLQQTVFEGVKEFERLQQNQAWVPLYDGDGDILAREYGVGPEADKIKLDPVLEGVSIDELMDAIPDWQA